MKISLATVLLKRLKFYTENHELCTLQEVDPRVEGQAHKGKEKPCTVRGYLGTWPRHKGGIFEASWWWISASVLHPKFNTMKHRNPW